VAILVALVSHHLEEALGIVSGEMALFQLLLEKSCTNSKSRCKQNNSRTRSILLCIASAAGGPLCRAQPVGKLTETRGWRFFIIIADCSETRKWNRHSSK